MQLLICNCGDCTHWEIGPNEILCKTCEREYDTPGIGEFLKEHIDKHTAISWKEHER